MTSKCGFIGLGVMGGGMARRILGSGQFDLTVFDVDAANLLAVQIIQGESRHVGFLRT